MAILVTYRITEVVSLDQIGSGVRNWFGRQAYRGKVWKGLADLINCPYCTGVWVALGITAVIDVFVSQMSVVLFIIYWLSVAGGQAFMESITQQGSD